MTAMLSSNPSPTPKKSPGSYVVTSTRHGSVMKALQTPLEVVVPTNETLGTTPTASAGAVAVIEILSADVSIAAPVDVEIVPPAASIQATRARIDPVAGVATLLT